MGKTRVHLLAKELGIETKDLIAQLDRLGIRGRKAQSALEEDEVSRVRAALAAQEKPQVHVARILGRIDLKQSVRVEPAPTPVLRRPVGVPPAHAGARPAETVQAPGADGEQKTGTEDKPKTGRHKKRVVKKQDVLELREKELRGGRIPKKKRVLPGKE